MNTSAYSAEQMIWKVVIHVVFIASAVFLGLLDRLSMLRHGSEPGP